MAPVEAPQPLPAPESAPVLALPEQGKPDVAEKAVALFSGARNKLFQAGTGIKDYAKEGLSKHPELNFAIGKIADTANDKITRLGTNLTEVKIRYSGLFGGGEVSVVEPAPTEVVPTAVPAETGVDELLMAESTEAVAEPVAGEAADEPPTVEAVPEVEVVTSPASYPDTESLTEEPTAEAIDASVDKYIAWRRQHESDEGVLEPGRADVVAHSTSVDAGITVTKKGELKSVKSLICEEGSRIDQMQGGKLRYVVGATRNMINSDPQTAEFIMANRQELVKYFPNLSEDLAERITSAPDPKELAVALRDSFMSTETNGSRRNSFVMQGGEWSYMANLLPQDKRQIIADRSGAEPYVSTTLGHGLEKYTGDQRNPSNQAVIVLDVQRFAPEMRCSGGGTQNDGKPFSEEAWAREQQRIQEKPSKIFTSEYREDGAAEVSLLDGDPNGTTVDLSEGAVILLPASRQEDVRRQLQQRGKTDDNVVYFDDKKFRSVDEVLGWLVTTPEGKKIKESKMKPVAVS